uniref:Protein tweety homolog n=1 Tax=Glossina brevipalpis TaxID=37001 RepID=A0A1A9WT40_9MUSC
MARCWIFCLSGEMTQPSELETPVTSLGILASIPAGLLILSLFGLLLYLLTRCCDRKPRKPSAQRCQSCSLVIITLMTCASIGLENKPPPPPALAASTLASVSTSIFNLRQH